MRAFDDLFSGLAKNPFLAQGVSVSKVLPPFGSGGLRKKKQSVHKSVQRCRHPFRNGILGSVFPDSVTSCFNFGSGRSFCVQKVSPAWNCFRSTRAGLTKHSEPGVNHDRKLFSKENTLAPQTKKNNVSGCAVVDAVHIRLGGLEADPPREWGSKPSRIDQPSWIRKKKRMPGPLTPFWVQTLLTVQVRPDSQTLSPQVTFFKRLDINHLWG